MCDICAMSFIGNTPQIVDLPHPGQSGKSSCAEINAIYIHNTV